MTCHADMVEPGLKQKILALYPDDQARRVHAEKSHRSQGALTMRRHVAALVTLLLLTSPSRSEILLEHAWAQASPPKAVVGRAFVTIVNQSDETEHLIGVSTEAASSAEISGIRILQNVPNMRRLFNIDIPPHRSIIFAPGSYHILLRNLRKPLVVGDRIDGEMMFENAGAIPVEFRVEEHEPAAR